jgi:bifunctional non-homologous end joining protein LigD
MKHSKVWAPPALQRVDIQEKTKIGEYLIADSGPALVSLVQINVLEIHTWNSRVGSIEQPDRLVLDIDPGPEITWPEIIAAARLVRRVLESVGLDSFVKTTGGRGLHVVVPLQPQADWSACLALSRGIAAAIVAHDPDRYTTRFAKAGRERKILIDYLRNNRTNTSVAAFSTRAKPHAPVSMPLSWTMLTPRVTPDAFTVQSIPTRLARLRHDPWAAYWRCRQRLTPAMAKAFPAGM